MEITDSMFVFVMLLMLSITLVGIANINDNSDNKTLNELKDKLSCNEDDLSLFMELCNKYKTHDTCQDMSMEFIVNKCNNQNRLASYQ